MIMLSKIQLPGRDNDASEKPRDARREARQNGATPTDSNLPRGHNVPLFTTATTNDREHAPMPWRERAVNGDYLVGGATASQHTWNTDSMEYQRALAYESALGIPISRKPKYNAGTIQQKMCAQGIPAKTVEQAIDGEFVQISDFLSPIGVSHNLANPDLECVLDNDNRITYKAKKNSRKITNCDLWCQAWGQYEKLLVGVYGIRMHDTMSDYRAFIMEANRKFLWSAVATYDFKHRSRLCTQSSLAGRFDFNSPSQDLIVTILDATAIKPNALRCMKCKGYDHVASGCPFPDMQPKAQSKTQSQSANVTSEICYNFNRDRCQNDRCRRVHKCRQCRGPLPLFKCLLSGPCASTSKVNTQSQQ